MGGWEPQLCGALISGHLGPFLCPLSSAKPLREEPGDWKKMGTFTSKWAHSPSKWALSPPNGHFHPTNGHFHPPKGHFHPKMGTFTQQMGTFTPKMGTFTPEASAQPQALQCWCTEQGSPPEGHQTRLFCLFPEPRSKQPTRSTQSRGFS